MRNKDQVICRMKAAVASKQFGQEDILCSLVADVIISFLLLFVVVHLFYLAFWWGVLTLLFSVVFVNIGMHPSVPQEPCKL